MRIKQYILDAIEDAENGRNLGKKYTSVDDFFADMGVEKYVKKRQKKRNN